MRHLTLCLMLLIEVTIYQYGSSKRFPYFWMCMLVENYFKYYPNFISICDNYYKSKWKSHWNEAAWRESLRISSVSLCPLYESGYRSTERYTKIALFSSVTEYFSK